MQEAARRTEIARPEHLLERVGGTRASLAEDAKRLRPRHEERLLQIGPAECHRNFPWRGARVRIYSGLIPISKDFSRRALGSVARRCARSGTLPSPLALHLFLSTGTMADRKAADGDRARSRVRSRRHFWKGQTWPISCNRPSERAVSHVVFLGPGPRTRSAAASRQPRDARRPRPDAGHDRHCPNGCQPAERRPLARAPDCRRQGALGAQRPRARPARPQAPASRRRGRRRVPGASRPGCRRSWRPRARSRRASRAGS